MASKTCHQTYKILQGPVHVESMVFLVFVLYFFALQVHTLDLRESTKRTCTSLRSLQGLKRADPQAGNSLTSRQCGSTCVVRNEKFQETDLVWDLTEKLCAMAEIWCRLRDHPKRSMTERSWVSNGKFCSSNSSPNSPWMSHTNLHFFLSSCVGNSSSFGFAKLFSTVALLKNSRTSFSSHLRTSLGCSNVASTKIWVLKFSFC